MNIDTGTTETEMMAAGYVPMAVSEFRKLLLGNTILGDFGPYFKYIMTIAEDGTLEGINNAGSHNHGRMTVNQTDNTISVEWDESWINNTSRAYLVGDEIKLFDVATGLWGTTFTKIMPGTDYEIKLPLPTQ